VHNSFDIATYEPASEAEWDEAYTRFLDTMEQSGQSKPRPLWGCGQV